ncbi:hypothetical protein [Methanobrevibacter sp.]|uniref:hypothetical protein n=1 Tax=Methanobrevibacter sp. TaxID=66852 RepID=UPI00389115D8
MTKKKMGILLILLLVMIMSIGAVSAADTNDTLLEEVSDTNIATDSVALEQEVNDTSPAIESVNDTDEISVDDSRNENHKVGIASSSSDNVLSATNEDLLKSSENNFLYNGNWYKDLDDAFDDADDEPGSKTIYVWRGTYKYTDDSDDFSITLSDEGVYITLKPYDSTHTVIFDAEDKDWFFKVTNNNVGLTICDITFKNGNANEGNLEVEDGAQLNLYRCKFESNKAYANTIETLWGLGGAINVDEGSLVAEDCQFINNWAGRYGGAICVEDAGSVTLNNCYFEGNTKYYGDNKVANDFDNYDEDKPGAIEWNFDNCLFVGSGSLGIEVDAPEKSVTITPNINDDANLVVLYKDGSYYDEAAWASGHYVTFKGHYGTGLDAGTYTVYMMKDSEKRYEYSGNTFTIIEPNFILYDGNLNYVNVFETLSAAVNAISSGGTGVIAVKGGTYTGSGNRNVQINNKEVTIMPKSDKDSVTFSGDRSYGFSGYIAPDNFLIVGSNSKLTIEDITITDYFDDSALKFTANSEGNITGCEFNNIKHANDQPGNPIKALNSNLVLDGSTFESNSKIILENTVANINDCTFTSNHGINGGAIYADSSSYLTVTLSEFNLNSATTEGGAIYATNLELHGNEFIGNSANLGGAIYITSQSESLINMTNCVFDSNSATKYRNIYSESLTRKFNFESNEYDLDLKISLNDSSYGDDNILNGDFDWGSNLNNTYTLLIGFVDEENIFGDMLTIVDNKFNINLGVLPSGTHEFVMAGMYTQEDSNDHFWQHDYYNDLYGNEFYLSGPVYAKIGVEKAKINLTLEISNVLIPEIPVLNVYADWDLNYTIIIQNKYYPVEVVNGKGSIQLTGLDLGNYTVVAIRDTDDNFELAMNYTTFSIAKTYSNFLVLSTNVEYDTLNEAVANSNDEDTIYVKNGIYKDTGIVISNKILDIIALEGAVFDAQGGDANFIIVNENAVVDISGITFRGLHNRNTNYGAIVNHGYLALTLCNFTDNKITKTSFAENGGAAIFSDGYSLDIDSCNFINNAAPLKVSTAAVTSLGYEDVSIMDSKFINNSARDGGALYFKNITQFEAVITSCDFESNTAVKGSAIYVGNNSKYIAVILSDFKKNDIKNSLGEKTQLEGGVIYVNANSEVVLDISLSNFEDNANSNVDGGVICLDGLSKANIDSCIFNNNSGKVGSAILIKNPYDKKLTLFIDSSAFTNNHAVTGAIATSPKVTTFIDECVFANNTGQNRNIYSNGFTVVHDSVLDVKDAKLNAPSVQYGESSTITGTADVGTNIYAAANLTVAGDNNIVEIKNNSFTYNAGVLDHGKYSAVLNSIADNNNNTYIMDSITEIFRVNRETIDINVSVDNITYGETLKVVESLPSTATGAIDYQLNGKYYTKDEIESLILDAGKYTLVAIYDHEDFAYTSITVDFEVYKANPTISVPNVEVEYNDSIVLNIESDVASIYTIEIGDYKNVVFVNGSRTVVIDKTLNPGNYTIKVTSQERVNHISNSTEANLNVNGNLPVYGLRISNTNMDDMGNNNAGEIDSVIDTSNNVEAKHLLAIRYFAIADTESNENIGNSIDNNNLGEEDDEGRFMYQYDEDDDYSYFDTLEDAVDEAILYGAGIITVRGGTYSVSSMDIEGEVELTIRAYGDEEVIFDCGGEYYFMLLTYETEVEAMEAPPFFYTYQTEGPTVTLENITVINGVATYGGAIDLEAGTLTLTNCNFYSNTATEGGAIYIGQSDAENDAMLIALNTTFINNYAESEGGAIYIADDTWDGQTTSASFYLCTFLDNYQGEDDERIINYFAGGKVNEIVRQYCIFNANGEIYNLTIDKINQTVYVNGTSNDAFDSVVLLYFDAAPLYTINNNGSLDFSITFEDVMGGNYTIGVMNDHKFNTYIFDDEFVMKVCRKSGSGCITVSSMPMR